MPQHKQDERKLWEVLEGDSFKMVNDNDNEKDNDNDRDSDGDSDDTQL